MTGTVGQTKMAAALSRNSPAKMKSIILRCGTWLLYRRAAARRKVVTESSRHSATIRTASISSMFSVASRTRTEVSPRGIISRDKSISTMVEKLMLLFFFFFSAGVFIGLSSLRT